MDYPELIFQTMIPQPSQQAVKETLAKLENNLGSMPQNQFEHPTLHQYDYEYQMKELISRIIRGSDYISKNYPDNKNLQINQHVLIDNSVFYLNWNAFLSTIQMLGTTEQVEHWSKLIFDNRIIGGYGQTEIGHGSDVQGLQTTASFCNEDDTFILNTDKASAYKLWPGLLGTFATHMVMQAQTTINGKNVGIQTFIVPIRDQNHKPYPGVDAGDQGMKLNFIRADNGFLGLKNYKIPRQNLLQRYFEVKKDGSYIFGSKDAVKFGYGSMLNLRVTLTNGFAYTGMLATSLAFQNVGKRASQLQNLKMLRSFATQVSILMANRVIQQTFDLYNNQLQNKHKEVSNTLIMVHIYSSAMKSISAWETIKSCREAVQISPFGQLSAFNLILSYADYVPSSTYEGDNNVLLQQSAKYLMKQFKNLQEQKPTTGPAEYFNKYVNAKSKLKKITQISQITQDVIQEALEILAFETSKQSLTDFFNYIMNDGHSLNKTWNELNQVTLITMTKIFTYANIFILAKKELEVNLVKTMTPEAFQFIKKLITIFGLFLLIEYQSPLLAFNILETEQELFYNYIEHQVVDFPGYKNQSIQFQEFLTQCTQYISFKGKEFMDVNLTKLDFNQIIGPKL